MFQQSHCALVRLALCCVFVMLARCVPVEDSSDEQVLGYHPNTPDSAGDSAAESSIPGPDAGNSDLPATLASYSEAEPNDTWAQAQPMFFPQSTNGGPVGVQIAGSIAAVRHDFDVFAFGPVLAGHRVQADLAAGGADVQLGFFDAEGRVVAYVDPRSSTAGPSHIDIVLREASTELYAIVGTRSTANQDRPYTATITIGGSDGVPAGNVQAVVLVFNGASQVRIGSRVPVNVPAFDIGHINSAFAGRNEEAIALLMDIVREDYDGLNVTFYRDTDADAPTTDCTKIYFGYTDTALLGLADNIDPYNSDTTQSAIIYTDTFSLFNQLNPSMENMVQVLANVTSHEAGHLLGLRHTADIQDLMDVTASARQMMADQWFKTAALDDSVMPYGVQDAPAMLAWGVGGQMQTRGADELKARRIRVAPPTGGEDFYIPRSKLADCGCPLCTAHKH